MLPPKLPRWDRRHKFGRPMLDIDKRRFSARILTKPEGLVKEVQELFEGWLNEKPEENARYKVAFAVPELTANAVTSSLP